MVFSLKTIKQKSLIYFSNLKLANKMFLLIIIFIIGYLLFALLSFRTLHALKVNGSLYLRIIQGKDLIADVLPPPEYIIESYLIVLQMPDEKDSGNLEYLIQRGKILRKEYEERHDFWVKTLPDDDKELKLIMIENSYKPAMEFYRIRDNELIPYLRKGEWEKAKKIASGVLRKYYEEHRTAIDAVVVMSKERNKQDEARAKTIIKQASVALIILGFIIISIASLLSFLFVQRITTSLSQIMNIAKKITTGDFAQEKMQVTSIDEMGQLAIVFNKMAESLKEIIKEKQKVIQLEELNRLQDDFLATVSHDLSTPITTIMGYATIIKNEKVGVLNANQLRYAESIIKVCKYFAYLVDNLLSIVRIRTGKIIGNKTAISLKEIAFESSELLKPMIEEKSIQFSIDASQEFVLEGDEDALKQLFANLISNAVKFTPNGGNIKITINEDKDKEIDVSVIDNGRGIPPERIPFLFEKFTKYGDEKGLGLGLHISKKIVEAHGGEIFIKSEVDKGTKVSFSLNKKDTLVPETIEKQSVLPEIQKPVSSLIKGLILVLDDDKGLTALLKETLEIERFWVEIAYNTKEARELIKEKRFDLYLFDVNLPEEDGFEFCKSLRKEGFLTPIIFITSRGNLKDKIIGFEIGADDYICKPFDLYELVARINAKLKR